MEESGKQHQRHGRRQVVGDNRRAFDALTSKFHGQRADDAEN
jgi:hypothetical protein